MANRSCLPFALLSLVTATTAFAQTAPPIAQPWSGWAYCQLTIRGRGTNTYTHDETHLWAITGAGRQSANMEIYPTTWTVTGGGSMNRNEGRTRVSAQWTGTGTLANVEIGFTRHLDRITFQRWTGHGPAREAFRGAETRTTNGVGVSRKIAFDVQQWTFPAGQTTLTSTRITGSNTMTFPGSRGPMGPTATTGTAVCSWDFARGGVSPSTPPT